ncbi:hypothetical protein B566_EDAN001224 [Ephemera danica]|nr:hypothetical protein B566_EDAN001224 [Ephemera danica]
MAENQVINYDKEGLINQVVQFITSKEALHVQQLAPSEKTKTNSTAILQH